ncbi:hypothetical protein [Reyranella sp.]|jgi:hypothetical protein|uniref:hypothetical protein n=1 Tax=Reyranella sp. TaxID=1929291 RepID=UPI002F92812C
MALVKLREDPGTTIRVIYLVDGTVGRGGANRRDDVLLVQFFLNALWGKLNDGKTVFGGPGAAPAIDGVCGRITTGVIEAFQKWYWVQPARGAFIDGRVDPLPPGLKFGPVHKLPYTIIGLNAGFGLTFSVDRHARLSKEPGFPMELKSKLFV